MKKWKDYKQKAEPRSRVTTHPAWTTLGLGLLLLSPNQLVPVFTTKGISFG